MKRDARLSLLVAVCLLPVGCSSKPASDPTPAPPPTTADQELQKVYARQALIAALQRDLRSFAGAEVNYFQRHGAYASMEELRSETGVQLPDDTRETYKITIEAVNDAEPKDFYVIATDTTDPKNVFWMGPDLKWNSGPAVWIYVKHYAGGPPARP